MAKNEQGTDLNLIPFSFDTTILVLFISAYSYGYIYYYEKGFCTEFNIPVRYSNIDLNTLLPFWTTAVVVAFFIFSLIYGYLRLSRVKKRLADILGINILLIVLIITMCYMDPLTNFLYWLFGLYFVITNSVYLISHRKRKIVSPEKKKLSVTERKALLGTVRMYFFGFIGISALSTLLLSESFGRGTALRTTKFFVLEKDTQVVVLRNYNDRLLCRRLDAHTGKLMNLVIIIPLNSMPITELKEKELGRLTDYYITFQPWKPLRIYDDISSKASNKSKSKSSK